MEVILTNTCWKYYVPEDSVRASEWNGPDKGDKATISIHSPSGSTPYTLTITDNGKSLCPPSRPLLIRSPSLITSLRECFASRAFVVHVLLRQTPR